MSLTLWPFGPKSIPLIPISQSSGTAPAEVRIAVIGTGHLQSGNCGPSRRPVRPTVRQCVARRRDAHDFAFATLVSRIR
jgi:hypothetical protein